MPLAGDSPFAQARIRAADVDVSREADGSIRARSPHALGPYPERLTDRLVAWASDAPDRTFLARRTGAGDWERLTYGDALRRMRRIAQALLDHGASRDRPVLILSGNSLEHALVAFASMYVGVPHAPVAPAYSLAVRDHTTIRRLTDSLDPALIFAADGLRFEAALDSLAAPSRVLVTVTPPQVRRTVSFADLESAVPTRAVDEAHGRVRADTIAKILFTSGSTGDPKGVINTQRMLCANLEQIRSALQFLADRPPVLCDWLPWNHTFGGNHNVGIALYNGGTLYIDDGRPAPGLFEATVRNLRDVATTAFFNVPKGFEMLRPVLESDESFRRHFFSELRLLFYAAAGLRPDVAEAFQRMAIDTLGRPVPWVTGLGATETAPAAMFTGPLVSPAAHIGVPVLGVELKAVPVDGRLEARVRGPNVTPGYWRDDALTCASFDEDGFYRMGDAIAPVDPDDLTKGFRFDGRLKEDFKLSTGTWVRVGALRARLVACLGDLVQDVVLGGHERDDVRALIFPNLPACRALAHASPDRPARDVLADPAVRDAVEARLRQHNADQPGSSTAIRRAALLDIAPSLDAMELTDKGSLNQRAVLRHRAAIVDALYASDAPILLDLGGL
jgi:feruloyl-CoA synthase